jgi:glycosyltransferase involved in cell wall biosynthesis
MTADAVGGVWTYALELCDALAERDVEPVLAVLGGPLRPDQRDDLHASRVERVLVSNHSLEWMNDPWEAVDRAGTWLLGLAEEVEPDVVHLNGYAHAPLPWGVPAIVVGHSCVLSWHRATRGRDAGPEWRTYASAVRRGLSAASLLVAPTRAMLDELVQLYEPPCPRLVVPNGRSLDVPRVAKEPLVLAAGRMWDEAKNVAAVAAVAPRLDWRVALVGPGTPTGVLPRRPLDLLLARASIFVAPARYEPFGLAPLEAALAGCALVLGDIASLREVWGDAACFVPPDDHERLEHALGELIRDDERRRVLADRARARAAFFTPARMADGYLDAYGRARAAHAVEVS